MKTTRLLCLILSCGALAPRLVLAEPPDSPVAPAPSGTASSGGSALDKGPGDRDYHALHPIHAKNTGSKPKGLLVPGQSSLKPTAKTRPAQNPKTGIRSPKEGRTSNDETRFPRSLSRPSDVPSLHSAELGRPAVAATRDAIPGRIESHPGLPGPSQHSQPVTVAALAPVLGRSPAPPILGGLAFSNSKYTAAINGTTMKRRP
jgi:hypothetical protein